MNENELWKIQSFDSEDPVKRTKMKVRRDSFGLELYSLTIPSSWSVGDKVGLEPREDTGPGYVNLSNKTKGRANKPKDGPVQFRVIGDPDGFLKSLKPAVEMEYPYLGEDQKIIKKDPAKIWLGDDCGSEWYFHPDASPLPEDWVVGDSVIVDHIGAVRKGEKKRKYKITNTRTKKDALGTWENPGEKKPGSYVTEKRKGPNDDIPARPMESKEFDKFGKELVIEDLDDKIISLTDGRHLWEFQWYSLIGHYGEWRRGDTVIVTKSDKRASAKAFTITNVRTGKFLTIMLPSEEDEE